MKALHRKLALGLVIGVGSVAMFGAAGLGSALPTAANADVDKAVAANKITTDQATALRAKIGGEITSFVDRTWPTKPTAATRAPNVKGFLGEMSKTAQTFLGLSAKDI